MSKLGTYFCKKEDQKILNAQSKVIWTALEFWPFEVITLTFEAFMLCTFGLKTSEWYSYSYDVMRQSIFKSLYFLFHPNLGILFCSFYRFYIFSSHGILKRFFICYLNILQFEATNIKCLSFCVLAQRFSNVWHNLISKCISPEYLQFSIMLCFSH